MLEYFRNFLKHSMVYGIGNGIYRLGSFLLIPLYTKLLLPSDYGELELFYVFAGILRTFLGLMIAHGTLRFFFEFDSEEDKKKVIGTSLVATFGLSIIGCLILWWFLPGISTMIFKTSQFSGLLQLVLMIVSLELTKEVGLAFLRAKEKSLLYVLLAIVQLLSQVGLNVYLVLFMKRGVSGILLGNLVSTALVWLIIVSITLKYCGWRSDFHKLKLLLKYCFPFILSTVAGIVISSTGRLMLNNYKDLAAVGVYALALKFGTGVQELVMEPFSMNFGQSRFAIMHQSDAKAIYARVLTYFAFVLVFVCFAVSIFSREILILISSSAFIAGYKVIPLVLLAIVAVGITYILQTGIMIEKKTKYIFYVSTYSAVLTIILNWLLIPRFDMYGAAVANLLVMAFGCWLTYFYSNRFFPIPYEMKRLLKMILAAVVLYVGVEWCLFVSSLPMEATLCIKGAVLVSYPFSLRLLSFYEADELNRIRMFLKRTGQ